MEQEHTLQRFKVTREKLRKALEEAKAKHEAEVAEAENAFAQAVAKFVDDARKAIEVDGWNAHELRRRVASIHTEVPEPTSHAAEYEAALKKLELMTSDSLWLADEEFRQYVLDQWHWKRDHLTTVAALKAYGRE